MTQHAGSYRPGPAPATGEFDPRTRRRGPRLYLLGAVAYTAGITIALLAARPTARAAAWTIAWAAILLGAGGGALFVLRRRKAHRQGRA